MASRAIEGDWGDRLSFSSDFVDVVPPVPRWSKPVDEGWEAFGLTLGGIPEVMYAATPGNHKFTYYYVVGDRSQRMFNAPSIVVAAMATAPKPHRVTAYPAWLNASSAASIAAAVVGSVAMFWDTTAGAAIGGLGFAGIWLFGSIASRLKENTNGGLGGRS